MAISPAFLGNYVTGRRHITKIKIDRWIVIFSILSVKWICKETKRNILSFVFKTIMYKYIKSPTYDVHNCSTIRMCGEKYMSGIVAQHCLSNQWRIWIFDHIPMNCIIVFFFSLSLIKLNLIIQETSDFIVKLDHHLRWKNISASICQNLLYTCTHNNQNQCTFSHFLFKLRGVVKKHVNFWKIL